MTLMPYCVLKFNSRMHMRFLTTKHIILCHIIYFNTMFTFLSTVKKPAVGNGRLFNGKDHINAGQFTVHLCICLLRGIRVELTFYSVFVWVQYVRVCSYSHRPHPAFLQKSKKTSPVIRLSALPFPSRYHTVGIHLTHKDVFVLALK